MNIQATLRHRTFERKTALPAVALATLFAVVTDSALADAPRPTAPAESVTATVSLADLDVSTPEGAQAASARLAKLAQRLCLNFRDARRVSDWATYTDCYRETLANALRQAKLPVIAALPRQNLPQR